MALALMVKSLLTVPETGFSPTGLALDGGGGSDRSWQIEHSKLLIDIAISCQQSTRSPEDPF